MYIYIGNFHSAATTAQGRILTWGEGARGQLGLGSSDVNRHIPTLVEGGGGEMTRCHFVSVGCGVYHTAAVTDSGMVFTWGLGADGQLGGGNEEPSLLPAKVPTLGPSTKSPRNKKREK
jgi:alpha-tubulin suppressor-like RCC1 family protein